MHRIVVKVGGLEYILTISHESVQDLACLLKKKISAIEYVLDCKKPRKHVDLKRKAKEYQKVYDLLIKVKSPELVIFKKKKAS